ncbi:MAG: polysaccharide deacetylase family protein [Bacteroidales bacterium]|nr:polysaccharide deacetylase family protein [Bacteroidales bacterium]
MILMYHNVDEQAGFNTVSAENFERQIRFVKQHWQLTDMDTYVRECRTNPRMATVTFDDAYSCLAASVLPIIRQLEIPITVFVPVSYIGKYNEWDENLSGFKRLNIFSWNEIESLSQNSNVTIGSHGMSHTSFGKMSINQSEDELGKSKEVLEKHLQKSVDYFAFPFGQNKDFGFATPDLLERVGYKAAVSTLWGRNNLKENHYRLRRVEVKPTDSIEDFQCYLKRKIDFRFIKQEIKNLIR